MAATEASSLRRQAPKRYICNYEGCGKAFTRSGHLLRHSQNHTDIAWACDRCEASFKREDLLERHKARHGIKDKRAGGTGLGRLVMKKYHRKHHARQRDLPGIDNNFLLTDSLEGSTVQHSSPGFIHQSDGHSPQRSESSTGAFESHAQADGVESHQSPPLDQPLQSEAGYIMAADRESYSDIFGLSPVAVRRDLSQISTPPRDDLCGTGPETDYLDLVNNNDIEDFINSLTLLEQQTHIAFDPFRPEGQASHQNGQLSASSNSTANLSMNIDPMLQGDVGVFNYANPGQMTKINGYQSGPNPSEQVATPNSRNTTRPTQHNVFHLPAEVRERIISLILETHPLTPSGTVISMTTPELSLKGMQESLDLFATHFNTSYPLIHMATFNIERVDLVLLLSMILLGSTYKNKDAHQLSVCLYDALIPHVFGGLSNNASPELHRLQSLLLLDCYGMYRAGPSQRCNALLLHRVLLSSISIISRYHVKAKVGLPAEMVMSAEQSFSDFGYAEQYKRVVLLFFMWDVQNACFFSVTHSLSIDELDVALPCESSTWLAITEEEWKASRLTPSRPETVASALKFYLNDGADALPPREDMFALTLALHGLMSISNGLQRSSRFNAFYEDVDMVKTSSISWRSHMCNALEFWKARFDAFAMDNIQALESEILHCDFQRDSMGVFAIYRAAYIVVNVEVRHLQIAAGAVTIFGQPVEESDFVASTEWIQKWATESPEAVGRAAWQTGQMFREGMLNLKDWYVHDVFHYPWCLYLATLTCWAASRFSHLPTQRYESSTGISLSSAAPSDDSRKEMNRLVSMLASTNPSNMIRLVKKCSTRGLTKEMARYLRTIRWAAAHEAMIVLEELSAPQDK